MERKRVFKKFIATIAIIILILGNMQSVLATVVGLVTRNRLPLQASNTDSNIIRAKLHIDLSDEEKNAEVYFNLNAPKIVTKDGEFKKSNGDSLDAMDLIKEAIKVKGTPYDRPMTKMYYDEDLNKKPTVLDCAGLVQWAMAKVANKIVPYTNEATINKLGYKYVVQGFNRQEEFIPRSCWDWINNTNEKTWKERGAWFFDKNKDTTNEVTFFDNLDKRATPGGSIRNATLKYMGNDINVLKMSDPVTNDLRYWEYYTYDDQGNVVKKELPTGTIIISDVRAIFELGCVKGFWKSNDKDSNGDDLYDDFVSHAWIYIGDLRTSDPAEARINLATLLGITPDEICEEEDIDKYFKQEGGENTHWRIEETARLGGENVIISNIDPDAEYLTELSKSKASAKGYQKGMGPVWAFQVANGVKEKTVDLALKKTITAIKVKGTDSFIDTEQERLQKWEVVTANLRYGTSTNALYAMNKKPIKVNIGDEVKYSIKIFNEGETDAKASKIMDYIPVGLTVIDLDYVNVNGTSSKLTKDSTTSLNTYTYDEKNGVLEINLKETTDLLKAYNAETDTDNHQISSNEVVVTCRVNEEATGVLTNVAEIAEYQLSDGVTINEDIDSTANNWESPNNDNKITTNKATDEWRDYATGEPKYLIDGGWHIDFLAQDKGVNGNKGDDDDFDKLIVEIKSSYKVLLNKVDEEGNPLSGVTFTVTGKDENNKVFGNDIVKSPVTTDTKAKEIVTKAITEEDIELKDIYTITETEAKAGYSELKFPITLTVSKGLNDEGNDYIVSEVKVEINGKEYTDDNNDGKIEIDDVVLKGTNDTVKIVVSLSNNTITMVVENTSFDGSYNIFINKKDEDGNYMKDVEFTTVGVDSNHDGFGKDVITSPVYTSGTSDAQKIVHKNVTKEDYNLVDTYEITEEDSDVLNGYYKLAEPIEVTVEKEANASKTSYDVKSFKINGVEADEDGVITLENIALEDTKKTATITATIDKNDLTIIVENKEKIFDLALRKFITQVNKGNESTTYNRVPDPDVKKLVSGEDTTAEYVHSKEPILVERGNTVVYTIRVYNEGERDGYATEITDHLPESLEFVKPEYKEDGTPANINAEYGWKVSSDGKTVTTSYLKDSLIKKFDGKELDFEDIKIECLVSKSAKSNLYLTNIAEITKYDAENHKEVKDRDNEKLVEIPNDLPGYKNDKLKEKYVPGQEDDDDFEKVYVSLKGEYNFTVTKKDAETNKVIEDEKTTFNVTVYSRITEEDDEKGTKITLSENDEVKLKNKDGQVINTKGLNAYTNGIAKINGISITDLDSTFGKYYFVVEETQAPDEYSAIEYRVVVPIVFEENGSTYTAKHDTTQAFALVRDENGNEYKKALKEMATKENECVSTEETDVAINVNVPNKLNNFDLSLRKFITKVNDEEIANSREPQVDASKLAKGEATTATYEHTKEPVLVSPQDIVEYTIRIYNEGEISGYASLIMDDIPDGVSMIEPGNGENNTSRINADYRWKMYRRVDDNDKVNEKDTIKYNGESFIETTNANEAVLIVTDYLSKENGETMKENENDENPNLLQPFNPEIGKFTEANYRDIKVQFKVKPSNEEGRIITNYAQITEDTDKDGDPVEDRDSTTNEWIEGEDDQDIERIKVRYFDLALYKWVTQAIVTEDGKTTEYDSKHTAMEKSNLVDVVIPKNKLNKVTVKFKYQIRVENQGKLEGYAKEIKDHIPAGLKFVAEDNKEFRWVEQPDGTITTDYLKDTLLKPGETAEVTVVLTWINSETNLGQKVNYAEISEDYNDYGAPDIDSTPNNFENLPHEDDEDGDVVMLQVRTGMNIYVRYLLVAIVAMAIITMGSFGVKKFVLNRC